MRIENWTPSPGEPNGVIACFSVVFDHVTIDSLMLCRRRQDTGAGFVRIPKNRFTGKSVCHFSNAAYTQIMLSAFQMHLETTGEELRRNSQDGVAAEDEVSGLLRAVRADVEETLTRAGL